MMLREHERTQEKLHHDLGALILAALRNPEVIEIMCNPDGSLWVDTFNGMKEYGHMEAEDAKNLINTVATVQGTVVTVDHPDVGGEVWVKIDEALHLYRFQGLIPPIVTGPAFAIRKPAGRVIPLDEYVRLGVMTGTQADILRVAVSRKESILVVGGASSGKTTLCNAVLDEVARQCRGERIAIIEDTLELQCPVPNRIELRTSSTRNMDDLLRYCMRLRPDRIVVGEVRGKEAYSLVKAWNTGHPGGVSTVHGNSAKEGLSRLEHLITEAGVPPCPEGVVEAVKIVLFIEKAQVNSVGRVVREILRVKGYIPGSGYVLEEVK